MIVPKFANSTFDNPYFDRKTVEHLTTAAMDGIMELAETRSDYKMADYDF